ncbi:hypothetical protein GCM10010873_18410 [Cypionkella aquatica]|uniref:Acetolactate synthase n=1 Tax=Cypionkella aquatica TaxID=1756042 RepID=A0AA37X034_9RHOB|nr:DUF6497 family protein [Cypionkella aquatica]GLS86867.1 hypothetical protein GCM10010873_18410 [Cypionkella aquatica]
MTDPAVNEAALVVPSGQAVRFVEVVMNAPGPEGLVARFRFVAPAIAKDGGGISYDVAALDMEHLCNSFALPRIASTGPVPSQIIISFADRDVPFGEASPDATQFFEAYRIEGDACIWEAF